MKHPAICHPPVYAATDGDPHKITQALTVPLQQLTPLPYPPPQIEIPSSTAASNSPNLPLLF
jgi:hypothetical protein